MLSRVAENLYWMSRYLERAENTARLVEVNLQLLLDFEGQANEDEAMFWEAIVATSGALDAFKEAHKITDANTAVDFLTFNAENPSAILASVASARENARMIRDQITSEMWECLNDLYHYVRKQDVTRLWSSDIFKFYEKVRDHSALFQGLVESGFLHEQAHQFIQIGKAIERADQTSRLLDLKYFLILPRGQAIGGAVDTAGWIAVLRSCSAWDAFHQTFRGPLTPERVYRLLLLGRTFPRSVRFSLRRLDENLRAIQDRAPGNARNPAEKIVDELRSEVVYSTIDDIFAMGAHEFIDMIQTRLGEAHAAIVAEYFHPPETTTV